jgi:hypothetical protein
MVNICQQVAGAVSIGVLNTVAASAATGTVESLVDGLATTFAVCAVFLLAAGATAVVTLSPGRAPLPVGVAPQAD